jgi:hypothetical protein
VGDRAARADDRPMKWTSVYFLGYAVFMVGVFMALWKFGVLEDLGSTWTAILVILALGLGLMIAVANGGRKENISVDTH